MPSSTYKLTLDLPFSVSDTASVSFTEAIVHAPYLVAIAAADVQINFGGVTTIDVLYLKADQTLTFNFNDAAGTDITVDANKPLFSAGTAITSLYVSNASGSAASLYMVGLGA